MARKIPGPWELHADGIADADGQFILQGNHLGKVIMVPGAGRLILAAPEMLVMLKRFVENQDGFVKFESMELIRSVEEGT